MRRVELVARLQPNVGVRAVASLLEPRPAAGPMDQPRRSVHAVQCVPRLGQLADQANRRHEVWVAEGLRWLNHPLRAASSAPLVAPALAMVLTVNRTGNLFFDTAWLAAVLNGHSSPAVAEAVQQFLDEMPPGYPPRLRALVLQRADLLMRAARWQTP